MALVVLLRGINVGGHRTFRPAALAEQLKHWAAVNIGAAGTFVIRRPVTRTKLRAELARPRFARAGPTRALEDFQRFQTITTAYPCSTEGAMPQAKVARTKFERANPILSVTNMARSLRYYVDVLGFTNADWGSDDFTCVSRDGADIYLSQGDQGQSGTWVWLGVEDVVMLFEEYRQSGATILHPPENFPWACEMKIGDPDGHVLRFGSDSKEDA